mgnify:CR=1 FL=1
MDEFISLIPERLRKWYIFLIVSILFGQLSRVLTSMILVDNGVPVVPSLQNAVEMGEIAAWAIGWGAGGLIIYWRYVYRGKLK